MLLRANSHRDSYGRLVSRWSQEQLAAKLHVSVRTLPNLIADLREPGSDPRHPTTKAVGRRLGLVKVEPTCRDPLRVVTAGRATAEACRAASEQVAGKTPRGRCDGTS